VRNKQFRKAGLRGLPLNSTQTRKHLYLLALLPVALSCNLAGAIKKVADKAQEPTTLTSTDGRIQMVVPGGWAEDKTLNEVAVLQASNRFSEMYVIVISESRKDFAEDTSLHEYASLSRDGLMENVTDAEAKDPSPLQVSGRSALEYQISGSVDKIKVTYLCTVIETPTHFYQILTWTLPSRFQRNQETLRSVTQNFKEVNLEPPPKPTGSSPNSGK
jgi:hypothetical protein